MVDWPVPWQPVEGPSDGVLRQVEYLLLMAVLGGAGRIPHGARRALAGSMARLARRVDRRRSTAARVFLRQALGQDLGGRDLEDRVIQAWRHFFEVILEVQAFERRVPMDRIEEHFDVHWTDEAREVRDSPKGALIVAGHIGNWEGLPRILPRIGFGPLYGIGKPPKSRPLSREIQRSRERYGIRLLPRRGAIASIGKILASGSNVVLLLDQRARVKPVLAPFLGRPARCDRTAGIILRRFDVPALMCSCIRTADPLHYRVGFHGILRPADLKGHDRGKSGEGVAEMAATWVNREVEQQIQAWPEQYFWLHDRYRDTPVDPPPAGPSNGGAETH